MTATTPTFTESLWYEQSSSAELCQRQTSTMPRPVTLPNTVSSKDETQTITAQETNIEKLPEKLKQRLNNLIGKFFWKPARDSPHSVDIDGIT